ncbi:hypothetical protein HDV00_001746 [Rhizophlyctis rosea]|nr:hypothetical protein HDV00_001746 [Rhizophlyctis rosea]
MGVEPPSYDRVQQQFLPPYQAAQLPTYEPSPAAATPPQMASAPQPQLQQQQEQPIEQMLARPTQADPINVSATPPISVPPPASTPAPSISQGNQQQQIPPPDLPAYSSARNSPAPARPPQSS